MINSISLYFSGIAQTGQTHQVKFRMRRLKAKTKSKVRICDIPRIYSIDTAQNNSGAYTNDPIDPVCLNYVNLEPLTYYKI